MSPNVPARRRPREVPEAALEASLRRGVLGAGLMTLAGIGHVPLWIRFAFWDGLRFVRAVFPAGVGEFLLLTVLFLAPLLGVALLYLATRPSLVKAARRSHEEGRAVAAGSCIGMLGAAVATIALGHAWVGFPNTLEITAQAVAALFGVGVYGAMAFRTVQLAAPDAEPTPLPPVYDMFRAAGFAGPAYLAGGVAWSTLAWLFPGLSPLALVAPLAYGLGAPFGIVAGAVAVLSVAPVAGLMAFGLRRALPEAPRGALLAGVLLPLGVPLVGITSAYVSSGVGLGAGLAWMLGLGGVALLPNVAAAYFGTAGARRALPPGRERPALAAEAAEVAESVDPAGPVEPVDPGGSTGPGGS